MSPCKFGYCSFGLNIILKLVTIKLPCKVGTLRKLCSQVILFTIRYFSSPISTSCSRRPWICYLGTMDPNFSMLGRDRGSSKTIFGQSLFRFWFLWELLRNPTARFALLFFVVCGSLETCPHVTTHIIVMLLVDMWIVELRYACIDRFLSWCHKDSHM